MVLVSHSMEEIARNAQRIIVLDRGAVRMQGAPAEVFARARELESIGLDVPQVTKIAHTSMKRAWPSIRPSIRCRRCRSSCWP